MSTPRLIYIAGPMRGIPGWNYEAFDAAEGRLREAGWWPINPAATSRAIGYRPENEAGFAHHEKYLHHVMSVDIATIMQCEAIALLPGWERSLGSTVELALAQFLQLPAYCAITLELVTPGWCPWQHTWNYTGPQGDGSGEAYRNLRPPLVESTEGIDKALFGYEKVVCRGCHGRRAATDGCDATCLMCGGTGLVDRPFRIGGH